MDSKYQKELTTAIAAVQQAANLTRIVLDEPKDKDEVSHTAKADFSPVTIGDYAAQAILTSTISAAFPGDSFVGEESADQLRADAGLKQSVWNAIEKTKEKAINVDESVVFPTSPEQMCDLIDMSNMPKEKHGERVWVFDPIDGTQTFLRGELYAINVCLLVNSEQTVAVVGLPNFSLNAKPPIGDKSTDPDPQGGSILYAVLKQGAYFRPMAGPVSLFGPPIAPIDPKPEKLHLVTSLSSDSAVPGKHEEIAKALELDYPNSDILGWVPRWAMMALGFANVTYWAYHKPSRKAKIWDHAGAILIYQEVGGKVTDIDGQELVFDDRLMERNYGFVAAPAEVHGTVLEAVRKALGRDS